MHEAKIETIKQELAINRGYFPTRAVRDAIRQRDAVTPMLLQGLAAAADEPEALLEGDGSEMLYLYAMFLLAQFREQAAYPLLIRFFSLPGELSLDLTGDLVTEDLGRLLASVCGDDLAPMQRMIEDPAINEYVRSACLTGLTILVCEGRVPREQVIEYVASLMRGKLPREGDFIWSSLAATGIDLHPEGLLGDIERAFREGLVDTTYVSLEHVHQVMAMDKARVLVQTRDRLRGLIDDTEAEMSNWACFRAEKPVAVSAPSGPVVRAKKIGRNEPCPCGSGKKYKKCCMP